MLIRRISNWPNLRSSYDELDRMRWEMDKLFEGLTRGFYREPSAGVFPLVNMTESKDRFIIRAEIPGLNSEDIDISVTHDSVSISGERKIPAEKEGAKYHRRERDAGKFSRIVSLPGQIDTDKVEAKYVNGILTVALQKSEAIKPKQITVK